MKPVKSTSNHNVPAGGHHQDKTDSAEVGKESNLKNVPALSNLTEKG